MRTLALVLMRMLSLGVRTRMCLQSPDTDMSSVLNFAVLLLVAYLARGQLDCAYPTRTDLASVIQNTLRSGDAATKAKSTGDSSK